MYTVLIRIDETLPWIELKREYATRREAKQAAEYAIGRLDVKLVRISQASRPLKTLATVRSNR